MWFGFHCQYMNQQWEWISGEAVKYTNWNRGEPNDFGPNEDCASMITTWVRGFQFSLHT